MLALNGTTQSGGSTTASSIPGQNVVVLQLPLNTSNALDVWQAGNANRTDPLVLDRLYTANSQNNNYNTFNQMRLVAQGDLFEMPSGPVKIAIGGEYMWQEQQFKLSGGNNTGPTTTGSGYRVYNFDRDITSAFAEAAIPLVNSDWNIPALHKLEQQGWIATRPGISETNRQVKVYSLTRAGAKQLQVEVARWEQASALVARVLGAKA